MDDAGIRCVRHGWLARDFDAVDDDTRVVVYIDPLAHGGQGKALLRLWHARERFPEAYASVFEERAVSSFGVAVSWRLLCLGERRIWVCYTARNTRRGAPPPWMSNVADEVRVRTELVPDDLRKLRLPFPAWSVDWVQGEGGKLLAMDLNTAPDLSAEFYRRRFPPRVVYGEIARWFDRQAA